MPHEKTVYECEFNYCGRRFDTFGECESHEIECCQNPATHMCETCKWEDWYSDYVYDHTNYMASHRCSHPDANSGLCGGFGNNYIDAPACPHWESKTLREYLYLDARKADSRGYLSEWQKEQIDRYVDKHVGSTHG
jgi:hypothetical protein